MSVRPPLEAGASPRLRPSAGNPYLATLRGTPTTVAEQSTTNAVSETRMRRGRDAPMGCRGRGSAGSTQ